MPDARVLLADLVGFPTIAGTSNEALVDWAASRLQDAGATVRVLPGARADARNLHAVLGPAEEPGGVVLSAHTDVVAVEGQAWSRDPFALHEEDGRLYGRGATDMKGFIAAAMVAIDGLDVAALRRPLHVALSSDEELGCLGAPALLEAMAPDLPPPAWCVVGEPTGMRVAERHKGKLAFTAHVTGRAVHSARAAQGVNAVEVAARMIVALGDLGTRLRAEATDDAFAVPFATVSTGPIRGGVSLNIVPAACTFTFEVRTMPGSDEGTIERRMRAIAEDLTAEAQEVAPEAGVRLEPFIHYPPLAAEPDGDAAAVVAGLAGEPAGGAVDFGTEAGLFRAALGVPVVVCGPGDMAQGHVPDEFLEIEQLRRAEAFVRRVGGWLARRDGRPRA